MTEYEKMVKGEIYYPGDEELYKLRLRAHKLCSEYNRTFDDEEEKRNEILSKLLPNYDVEKDIYFQGPIYFDYGVNILIGERFYANFNFTVLDCCPVKIGNDVQIGSGVSLLTPIHPLRWQDRNAKFNEKGEFITIEEYAKPITIGDNCWLASNVSVIGGVSIGNGSVIGAGSVVTRDIPENVFAAGNPCRVIKTIE